MSFFNYFVFRFYSLPLLIRSIVLEIEKNPNDFGCLFTLPILPIIKLNDKLLDSVLAERYKTLFENIDVMDNNQFTENAYNNNSKKFACEKSKKNFEHNKIINFEKFGESWKGLVHFYFTYKSFQYNRNFIGFIKVIFFML